MKAITSIYIPRIETVFNAEFIADVFDRNGIAEVSRVYIEPYKSSMKNSLNYNRAYIGIKTWHATEAAFNFIERLRNPSREARIIYREDNWWPVDINKYPTKLASNKCVLTVFEDKCSDLCGDELSTAAVANDELEEFVHIDAEKTKLLRNIIANFPASKIYRTNSIDIDCNRELKASIYGYKNADEMDAAEAFNHYLREMDEERYMWSSE